MAAFGRLIVALHHHLVQSAADSEFQKQVGLSALTHSLGHVSVKL